MIGKIVVLLAVVLFVAIVVDIFMEREPDTEEYDVSYEDSDLFNRPR